MNSAPESGTPGAQKPKSNKLVIILSCIGVFLCVLVGGGYVAYRAAVGALKSGVTRMIDEAGHTLIEEAKIPEEQKEELRKQLSRLSTAVGNGEVSLQDAAVALETFSKSALPYAFLVEGFEQVQLAQSGLDEAEKISARKTLYRVIQGIIEEKIPENEVSSVVSTMVEENESPTGEKTATIRKMSDEELRIELARLEKLADDVGIPD